MIFDPKIRKQYSGAAAAKKHPVHTKGCVGED